MERNNARGSSTVSTRGSFKVKMIRPCFQKRGQADHLRDRLIRRAVHVRRGCAVTMPGSGVNYLGAAAHKAQAAMLMQPV